MDDDLRAAMATDFLEIVEDAILSGGLDDIVLQRARTLGACSAARPKARRRNERARRPRE